MSFRRLIAAALLSLAIPAALQSQQLAEQRRFSVGAAAGGMVTMGGVLDQYDPGWIASLAVRLQPGAFIPVQIELLHARATEEPFTATGPADEPVVIEPRVSITALTATALLAPWSRRTVFPYLLIGGGAYHIVPDERASDPEVAISWPTITTAGFSYGAGLEAPLGRGAAILEVRHHVVFPSTGSTTFIPVTLGFRF